MEIEKQIEELRAKRAALEVEYLAEKAERDLQDELAREQYGLENDEAFIEAEREIGPNGIKIALVIAPDGRGIIVRAPDLIRTKAFQAKKDPSDAELEHYISHCIHFPGKMKYKEIVKDFPLITNKVVEAVQDLGGASAKARAEKPRS